MTYRVDYDLGLRRLIENEVRIGGRRQASNGRIIRSDAGMRMTEQKTEKCLNACLHALGALRRMYGDVIEDRAEVGEGW